MSSYLSYLFVPVIRMGVEGNVAISDHIKSSENVRVILLVGMYNGASHFGKQCDYWKDKS